MKQETPPRTSTPDEFSIIRRTVHYREDASALFAQLGGTTARDSVLLESADVHTHSGITSVMVLAASLRLTCTDNRVSVDSLSPTGQKQLAHLRNQLADYESGDSTNPDHAIFSFPLSTDADERQRLKSISTMEPLRQLQLHSGINDPSGALPFLAGGWAFDYLATFEQLPEVKESRNTFPDYQFIMAEILLDINHEEHTATLSGIAASQDRQRVEQRLAEIEKVIVESEPEEEEASAPAPDSEPLVIHTSVSDAEYRACVQRLQRDIEQGEIYQVLPSRAFSAECPDAYASYRQLRRTNPSPYMFYVRGVSGEPYELFGASPESNLKYTASSREIQIYPVAGTKPRGLNPDGSLNHELDIRAELEMRTDSKELSEHIMLVDLARNDLARVAVPETRKVADLLSVDRYSRVMHLVSRVVATLADDFDALDAYRACMNMGTLTGAPKLRATELLRETEKERRGSYGGAVGYLRGSGDMDTCIVIRSAFVQNGVAVVQAGAGVVRDSRPQSEADETLHKAYPVLNALALAANRPLEVRR